MDVKHRPGRAFADDRRQPGAGKEHRPGSRRLHPFDADADPDLEIGGREHGRVPVSLEFDVREDRFGRPGRNHCLGALEGRKERLAHTSNFHDGPLRTNRVAAREPGHGKPLLYPTLGRQKPPPDPSRSRPLSPHFSSPHGYKKGRRGRKKNIRTIMTRTNQRDEHLSL